MTIFANGVLTISGAGYDDVVAHVRFEGNRVYADLMS
jgi:hypothetical protein